MAAKRKAPNRWSGRVTQTSDAMDIESGTFTSNDPEQIARAVEHDAETSTRRKTTPYRSAMSMLTFYINRGGKNLTAKHRKVLEDAKAVLREKFGPQTGTPAKPGARKKTTSGKKTAASKKATSRTKATTSRKKAATSRKTTTTRKKKA